MVTAHAVENILGHFGQDVPVPTRHVTPRGRPPSLGHRTGSCLAHCFLFVTVKNSNPTAESPINPAE